MIENDDAVAKTVEVDRLTAAIDREVAVVGRDRGAKAIHGAHDGGERNATDRACDLEPLDPFGVLNVRADRRINWNFGRLTRTKRDEQEGTAHTVSTHHSKGAS